MLRLFISSFLPSLFTLVNSSPLSFPLLLLFVSLFIVPSTSMIQPITVGVMVFDDVRILMRLMTLIVILISYFWVGFSKEVYFSLFFITLFCLAVFSSYRVFLLYLSYEASLIPILYIILK